MDLNPSYHYEVTLRMVVESPLGIDVTEDIKDSLDEFLPIVTESLSDNGVLVIGCRIHRVERMDHD